MLISAILIKEKNMWNDWTWEPSGQHRQTDRQTESFSHSRSRYKTQYKENYLNPIKVVAHVLERARFERATT